MKYFSFTRIRQEILISHHPPKITSISLALGVGLAFSPFPGLHLLSGLFLSKFLRLNAVVLLVGVFIHNPWTMLPIHFLGLMVGDLILNGGFTSIDQFREFPWQDLGLITLFSGQFWAANGHLLLAFIKPFILGSLVMSTLLGAASYHLCYKFLTRSKKGIETKPVEADHGSPRN